MCKLVWTTLFHDIGLFHKIEGQELDVAENDGGYSHAEYGYLFLRQFSPFPEYAKLVRYHHADWEQIEEAQDLSEPFKRVVRYLKLIDSADLYGIDHPEQNAKECLEEVVCRNENPYAKTVGKEILRKFIEAPLPDFQEMHECLIQRLNGIPVTDEEREAMLRTLINAIDFRSHYTAIHCSIMVKVSDTIGGLAGLNPEEQEKLHIGAMLHDLGKISIPFRILESSGKLEGEDWEVIKSHVSITEELLLGRIDEEILQTAVRHHETIDGKGYPKQIDGNSLTKSQRIAAVADIISALSEERSYKKAFPPEKILEILQSMKDNGKICGDILELVKAHQGVIFRTAKEANQEAVGVYDTMIQEYRKTCGNFPVNRAAARQ